MKEKKVSTCTVMSFAMNECSSMKKTLPEINKKWADRFLLIDGNSIDGTAEYARQMGWDVLVQSRPGVRHAYNEAFATIDTDLVLIWSPDGNAPATDIPRLLEKIQEGYDVVIASRYYGEALSEDDTFISKWANFIFTKTINILFGGNLKDAMTNYRIFYTKIYYDLALDDGTAYAPYEKIVFLNDGGLGVEPLFSARLLLNKYKVAEIASHEPSRVSGVAKFPKVRGGIGYCFQLLVERLSPHRVG